MNPLREVPPHITGLLAPRTGATVAVHLYSDVVALRTPSPSKERPVVPSRTPEMELNSTLVMDPDQPGNGLENIGMNTSEVPIDEYNSSMEVGTPDQADSHWTMVQRRRTRSQGSIPDKRTVTREQVKAIELATKWMTRKQRQQVERRHKKVQTKRKDSVSSQGEGPSEPKGKGIDPREWGNVQLSNEDLDTEA